MKELLQHLLDQYGFNEDIMAPFRDDLTKWIPKTSQIDDGFFSHYTIAGEELEKFTEFNARFAPPKDGSFNVEVLEQFSLEFKKLFAINNFNKKSVKERLSYQNQLKNTKNIFSIWLQFYYPNAACNSIILNLLHEHNFENDAYITKLPLEKLKETVDQFKIKLNKSYFQNYSPLHSAVLNLEGSFIDHVEFLFTQKVDPNINHNAYGTALHLAIKTHSIDYAYFDYRAIYLIDMLLHDKCAKTMKYDWNAVDGYGDTVLIAAIKSQKTYIALYLLKYCRGKIDINKCNMEGRSAINYAIMFGNIQIVQKLIEMGCDLKKSSVYGNNILYYLLYSHEESICWFLDSGVNPWRDENAYSNHILGIKNKPILETLRDGKTVPVDFHKYYFESEDLFNAMCTSQEAREYDSKLVKARCRYLINMQSYNLTGIPLIVRAIYNRLEITSMILKKLDRKDIVSMKTQGTDIQRIDRRFEAYYKKYEKIKIKRNLTFIEQLDFHLLNTIIYLIRCREKGEEIDLKALSDNALYYCFEESLLVPDISDMQEMPQMKKEEAETEQTEPSIIEEEKITIPSAIALQMTKSLHTTIVEKNNARNGEEISNFEQESETRTNIVSGTHDKLACKYNDDTTHTGKTPSWATIVSGKH